MEVEGKNAAMRRAGAVARRDAPTCRLDERLGEVRDRVRANGWDTCVVVNEERVVLGLLRARQLEGDGEQKVSEAMRPGPSTFRPHVSAADLGAYMTRHNLANLPITTGDGVLTGVLLREDAVEEHEHGHHHDR